MRIPIFNQPMSLLDRWHILYLAHHLFADACIMELYWNYISLDGTTGILNRKNNFTRHPNWSSLIPLKSPGDNAQTHWKKINMVYYEQYMAISRHITWTSLRKTKGQALCNGCREETHRAKMFSAHDIIPVSKYAKEAPKRVRMRNSFC